MPLDLTGTTIVFDLDGTIVDTAPDLAAATNHALALAGAEPVTVDELHPFIGHGSKAMIDAGLRFRGISVSDEEVTRLHEAFFAYYTANIAVGSRPFEGVPMLLDELATAGARLAVCTNKYEDLSKSLLEKLGLASRFGAIAGRDTFAMFKPAPGHLTQTIAMAGGRPDRAVMVGDSEIDFATAIAAKVPVIGVTFGYTPRPVRELARELELAAVIDHFREFMPALERAVGSWGQSLQTGAARHSKSEREV
jgi:phosphoglycolate phosphatase